MSYRIILLLIVLASCRQKENVQLIEYSGPLREAENVDMLYSEKDRIKVMMKAKKILEYKNGDQEFPEGLYLEFYSETGALKSTLKANKAYYFKSDNKWRGQGDVVVRNIDKQQQLNSEELFWIPATKKIFTEKFVTIQLESELIYGTGLDALQDMSSYTIKKPAGDFVIKD